METQFLQRRWLDCDTYFSQFCLSNIFYFPLLDLSFQPFPVIETDRLILREVTLDDAEAFFQLRTNIDAMRFLDKYLPKKIEEIQELIGKIIEGIQKNESIGWAICMKGNPSLLGTIGYHRIYKEHYRAEIGYMLQPAYWNKGIMSEAITKILDFGFNNMKLHSIEAHINPNNDASKSILKKFKFIKEAYHKENYFFNGKFLDTEIYSLLRNQ